MKKSLLSVISLLLCVIANAQEWKMATGIGQSNSVTSIFEDDGKLYAFGIKMWREGNGIASEPISFLSEDNGVSWKEYIKVAPQNSTANSLCISDGRMITSGRKGEVQIEWIGAVCYSDDNGNTWNEAKGIPSDISIQQIKRMDNKLIAFGQRQWKKGKKFLSEAKSYVSEDNGISWNEYISITKELTTASSLVINDGRIITSGRLGQAEKEWKGGMFYTDNNGKKWKESKGIPEDISITQIQEYDGKLYAVGQKQRKKGKKYLSEAKSYVSKNNGESWKEFIKVTDKITTANSLYISNGRLITSGRLGQAQMDWVGGVVYVDF